MTWKRRRPTSARQPITALGMGERPKEGIGGRITARRIVNCNAGSDQFPSDNGCCTKLLPCGAQFKQMVPTMGGALSCCTHRAGDSDANRGLSGNERRAPQRL